MKNNKRLYLLQIIISIGLLAGIGFSHELWFPITRTFPRVPLVFGLPDGGVIIIERVLSTILVCSLLLTIFIKNLSKHFLFIAILTLIFLIFFDQMRLQPWVYQYLLLLLIIAANRWQTEDKDSNDLSLGLIQITIAGLYIWSGLQKLNYSFSHEILPFLLTPLQSIFTTIQLSSVPLGVGMALTEMLIGIGLINKKTRKAAVCFAVMQHGFILTLLIAKDYNTIVWVWNIVLIPILIVCFWQSDLSIRNALRNTKDWKNRFAISVVCASVLLPALSFVGMWDKYLSGALYSGKTEVGVIRINDDLEQKLPSEAARSVFHTEASGEKMLPLFEWSLAELNVPVYPEERVFKRVTLEVCKLVNDNERVELIIRRSPAILDGRFEVSRIGCGQIVR